MEITRFPTEETPIFLDERGRRASLVRAAAALGGALTVGALITIVLAATTFSRLSPLTTAGANRVRTGHTLLAREGVAIRPRAEDRRREAALAAVGGARGEGARAVGSNSRTARLVMVGASTARAGE